MLRSDFAYTLPPELIAQEPRVRGQSRMMVVTPALEAPRIEHQRFARFPQLLSPGDLVVLNDTKVFPARLYAEPKRGMKNRIEVLLIREIAPLRWEAWCKPARRVRPGDRLDFSPQLGAEVLAKDEGGTLTLEFDGVTAEEFWSEVDKIGVAPLPPYIRRTAPRASDREAYQTVYATERGAVAAPTAGLHFGQSTLEELAGRGVEIVRITLHVGIGTFKPVKAERVADHRMDAERYQLTEDAADRLNRAIADRRRVVAIGTTTVRALESGIAEGEGRFLSGWRETSIFITPGFRFRAVDALLTNFHLPESTLLMLVSAFAGTEAIRRAYREAIEQKYLFYSFGDCMFITNRGS